MQPWQIDKRKHKHKHTHTIPYLSAVTILQKTKQTHVKAPKDEGQSS